MMYYDEHSAETRRKYEHDLSSDPVIREWLSDVATRATRPQVTVTFVDPFPYDAIIVWECNRCGCQTPTTVYGRKICGYCSCEGRERRYLHPDVRKKLLEQRVEEFLD